MLAMKRTVSAVLLPLALLLGGAGCLATTAEDEAVDDSQAQGIAAESDETGTASEAFTGFASAPAPAFGFGHGPSGCAAGCTGPCNGGHGACNGPCNGGHGICGGVTGRCCGGSCGSFGYPRW